MSYPTIFTAEEIAEARKQVQEYFDRQPGYETCCQFLAKEAEVCWTAGWRNFEFSDTDDDIEKTWWLVGRVQRVMFTERFGPPPPTVGQDIAYLLQCVEAHADKFPVPEHIRALVARIRIGF